MKKLIGLDRLSKTAFTQTTQKLYSCDWSCVDFTDSGYEIDKIVLENGKVLTDSEKTSLWETYLSERQSVELLNECHNSRQLGYTTIENQLDMIYWDKVNGTEKWKEMITKVKSDNPKPE